jgi:hypothetical protein
MAKERVRQTRSDLLHRHPQPHLVVGWTRNVNRWRDEGFFDLIGAQRPAGRYSVKRDFDEKRGQYLVLAAFERRAMPANWRKPSVPRPSRAIADTPASEVSSIAAIRRETEGRH